MGQSYEEEPVTNRPEKQIHLSHLEALQSRQNYISVSMSEYGQQFLDQAHRQLNRSVLKYLESMKYLLKTNDTVADFWHGRPPNSGEWDDGDAFLFVKTHHDILSEKDIALLKEQWEGEIEGEEFTVDHLKFAFKQEMGYHDIAKVEYREREDGRLDFITQNPVYGLKRLKDQWQNRTEKTEKKSGMLGVRTETNQEPELLPPEVLIRAGIALDEAADALGLLAEVTEDRPTYHAGADPDEWPEPHGTARKPI